MLSYFQYEKERVKRLRIAEATKGVGRPKVGGKFELVDHEGRTFSDEDMKGGFTLVSLSEEAFSWKTIVKRPVPMKLPIRWLVGRRDVRENGHTPAPPHQKSNEG